MTNQDTDFDSLSTDRKQWVKTEFSVFMNSVSILNKGLQKLKLCYDSSNAADITTETYVQLVKALISKFSSERKEDLKDKIRDALDDVDTDSECHLTLPLKR